MEYFSAPLRIWRKTICDAFILLADGSCHGMVYSDQAQTTGLQVAQKPPIAGDQRLKSPVVVLEMIRFNAGHHRYLWTIAQERTITLIGFRDHKIAAPILGPRTKGRE